MREILFRGKRLDNGEWAEGSLIHFGEYCCILEKEEELHPVDIPYLDAETGLFDGHSTPVDPATVGQYTGLTDDKNGQRIFEGDIIFADNGNESSTFVVKWGKFQPDMFYALIRSYYGVYPKEDMIGFYGESLNRCESLFLAQSNCVKIIGNIHDNPELLEGGAEGE